MLGRQSSSKTTLGRRSSTSTGRYASGASQGSDAPKTRAELYELAKQHDLPGRSKMGRDELANHLGMP
jgi:hypothetical protein